MSRENVEVVKRAYAALALGDLDALAQLQDPTIEWLTTTENPDATTYRGRVAFRRYLEHWMTIFSEFRAELVQCREAADGRVAASVRYMGRAQGSGIDMEWRQTVGFTVQAGRVVRGVEYFDQGEALEAMGLSE